MLILKLICDGNEHKSKEFKELEDSLKMNNILIKKNKDYENNFDIVSETNNNEIKKTTFLFVSVYIYKLILNNYLNKKMNKFLTETYFFMEESEVIEAKNIIIKVLRCENTIEDDRDVICSEKINIILDKIIEGIKESEELNVKGFVTFRAKESLMIIEKIIDEVIEKYMSDKEYKEFIKLLKYFVEMQDCKTHKIIIRINEDNYIVEDDYGNDLYKDFLETVDEKMQMDINIEDLIISGLISNAPKEIEIQNKENFKNEDFLNVIEKVFENKVNYINI